MQVTLTASTSAKIQVWREDDMLHSRLAGSKEDPQICLPVDLFEVIAELAGLELDDGPQAAEAIELAERAVAMLGLDPTPPRGRDAPEEPPQITR
jgi:hypothetical protein